VSVAGEETGVVVATAAAGDGLNAPPPGRTPGRQAAGNARAVQQSKTNQRLGIGATPFSGTNVATFPKAPSFSHGTCGREVHRCPDYTPSCGGRLDQSPTKAGRNEENILVGPNLCYNTAD
jgi:hypothetical protein